jgi:DNA modification methylase
MNDEFRQMVIDALRRGEDLPREWARELFPPEKREYELVYYGKDREEDILADTMGVPLQPVSTFGKPADGEWHNKLIFGDNLQAMKTLLRMKEQGQLVNADGTPGVRLVYIDPPFATKQDLRGSQDQKAYQDKIVGSEFIEFLRKRLVILRELLSGDGSIYLHLDYRRMHYMKCVCDEVFTEANFHGEIVWCYSGGGIPTNEYPRKHDTILWYTRGSNWIFNTEYREYSEGTLQRGRTKVKGPDASLRREGTPINDWWADIKKITSPTDPEKLYYPTQKSEDLLRRIIQISSKRGDIVLDAFAGSGTSLAVAEKLSRRWIGIDCGKLAIYTIQNRMLNLKSEIGNKGKPFKSQPFTLYNAGLYDFSTLRKLPREDWRFFALQLFGCRDEPHTIGGIKLDGKLKGASVLVFNHHENPGKRIDEDTVRDIHMALGKRIGSRFYIVAPRGVFDFQQDYLDFDKVRYYALRIPYSVINELHHREFTALRQPSDETDVNDIVDAWGFDFIQPPQVDWSVNIKKRKGQLISEACLKIKDFKSRARIRGKDTRGGLETFSMLMLDFDYNGEVFDMDAAFYAHQLEADEWQAWFSAESLGEKVMAVFIDIYGNEARVVIPRENFGLTTRRATTSKKKARS